MENKNETREDSVQIKDKSKVAVVVMSLPFQGHQTQLLQLSRVLSSYDDVSVHFIGTEIHNRQAKKRAQGWDPLSFKNLHFHDFPVALLLCPPPNPDDPCKFPVHLWPLIPAMLDLRDPVESLVRNLAESSKRVVIISDILVAWVVDNIPDCVPNVEVYCFHVFPAFALYYFFCGFAGKPVLIHGQPAEDLPTLETVFGENPLLGYVKESLESKNIYRGNLYNCSRIIEGEYLNLLEQEKLNDAEKHWAVGPLNLVMAPPQKPSDSNKKWIMDWLDKQRPRSVIYVAFGTATSFSDEQVKELAFGLERSGQNFIWLLRYADAADYNNSGGEFCRTPQLPEGFEEKIEGRGIIIRDDWVNQIEILGHSSTGGFLSHCGWNSCIESISMGVPIAAWPMHSEQPMNAVLVERVLKIGVLVRECTLQIDQIVSSDAIENAVRKLMDSPEGHEMRQRVQKLGAAVLKSVEKDSDVVAELTNFVAYISR